ncbi:hypothetical protein M758_4G154100 [Ceratodon purpureus]|nr:hypothetical protein M758_4G154100 [Ceratodon purpureus]
MGTRVVLNLLLHCVRWVLAIGLSARWSHWLRSQRSPELSFDIESGRSIFNCNSLSMEHQLIVNRKLFRVLSSALGWKIHALLGSLTFSFP